MRHTSFLPAFLLASLIAAPAVAEAPRIITLQETSDPVLPGAHDGARHGVKVFRGSGFPDPIIVETPKVVVEDTPKQTVRKKTKKKRKRGW